MESSGYQVLAGGEAIWAGISDHKKVIASRERGELMETHMTRFVMSCHMYRVGGEVRLQGKEVLLA